MIRSFRERYSALKTERERRVDLHRNATPIDQLEPGRVVRNERGSVFVSEYLRRETSLQSLAARDEIRSTALLTSDRGSQVLPTDLLFLDTETTGLAGGTGTHAFLVGLGFFDGSEFVLRQFFMRSPADELALLEELRALLERFRVLVTFNGKSFDWPLIDTRFVLHGYRLKFDFDHLDLLHPARRIWKHRLSSCSLTSLEQGVFGISREGDVPGYLIPQIYFDYLRDGDARRLQPVFFHNREDIVTLARLLDVLLRAEVDPDAFLDHAEDRIGMGLALLSSGQTHLGYRTLASALSTTELRESVRRRGEIELWRLMKRSGQAREGVSMLEAMCATASRAATFDLFPFVELAKYEEHVAHDFDAAEKIVERALRMLDLYGERHGRDELTHRLRRIRRKQMTSRVRTN